MSENMNEMDIYYHKKYLKYKRKYLQLVEQYGMGGKRKNTSDLSCSKLAEYFLLKFIEQYQKEVKPIYVIAQNKVCQADSGAYIKKKNAILDEARIIKQIIRSNVDSSVLLPDDSLLYFIAMFIAQSAKSNKKSKIRKFFYDENDRKTKLDNNKLTQLLQMYNVKEQIKLLNTFYFDLENFFNHLSGTLPEQNLENISMHEVYELHNPNLQYPRPLYELLENLQPQQPQQPQQNTYARLHTTNRPGPSNNND
jgi:hypothetical protein